MKWKSALVTDLSGKLGGMVASRNSGGNYFRAYANPVQPQTCRQNTVRAVFGELSSLYAGNSETDYGIDSEARGAWEDAAAAIGSQPQDFCGGAPLTGQQLFIRENAARKGAGITLLLYPPENLTQIMPPITVTVPTIHPGGVLRFTYDYVEQVPNDTNVITYVGVPQNPGRNFYGGPYQLANVHSEFTPTTNTTIIINADLADPSQWRTQYSPVTGRKLPLRTVTVHPDYLISQRYQCLTEPTEETTSTL